MERAMPGENDHPTMLADIVPLLMQNIERSYKGEGGMLGFASGFRDLDMMTAGIQRGYLAIGSKPGLGKTSMAMSMALAMAKAGHRGAYIMPSMNCPLFSLRMLALVSGIPIDKLRAGFLKPSDLSLLVKASEEMAALPLFLDDGKDDVDEIVETLRSLVRDHGVEWACIDSLDCVGSSGEAHSAEECAREVSGKLKGVSEELGLPLIALFQLDPDRPESAPSLRGGGPLAEAARRGADAVILISRREGEKQDEARKVGTRFIIAKNRFGPIGSVDMLFDVKLLRFCDLG
jgi:replicative DNA helicase